MYMSEVEVYVVFGIINAFRDQMRGRGRVGGADRRVRACVHTL